MKSFKRSAILFTIGVVGLLAIQAADKNRVSSSQQYFTLEELAWQSPVGAAVEVTGGHANRNIHLLTTTEEKFSP